MCGLRMGSDGYVIGEAVVDVCGLEDEVGQTVDEMPEVEDACRGGYCHCAERGVAKGSRR